MYKVVILDLDGTLVRTYIDWESIRERIREILGLSKDAPLKPIATTVIKYYSKNEKFSNVIELIESEELRSIESAVCPSKIPELLRNLRKCNYRVALVTLRSWRTTKPLLDKAGIQGVFDLIVTRDDAADRVSQLLKVMEFFRVRKEEVLFIGDWIGDVEAGKLAGVKTVIVEGPEVVVDLITDLLANCRHIERWVRADYRVVL